jgi:hypothetical protein
MSICSIYLPNLERPPDITPDGGSLNAKAADVGEEATGMGQPRVGPSPSSVTRGSSPHEGLVLLGRHAPTPTIWR